MTKQLHEIRDPIHVFVRMDTREREIVDTAPFQRLRQIHQLALTYLVYPGATHRRFEHSLGVMELAGRIYDVVTSGENINDGVKDRFPELKQDDQLAYWRRVVRLAALCHDIGHLPFSHAAEKQLLPEGWTHETITRKLILETEIAKILNGQRPPVAPEDVAKLALGPKEWKEAEFSDWEAVLAEIIVGDAFGADRMDYLLRDAYHAGVAYGKFDHHRLIDTLRLIRTADDGVRIGVEEGGIQSAEALLLARYFMYSQVYFHPVRRIYDKHLIYFMKKWLEKEYGKSTYDLKMHMDLTDVEVLAAMRQISKDQGHPAHDDARRIIQRDHFRILYSHQPADFQLDPDFASNACQAVKEKTGEENVRFDSYHPSRGQITFPVLMRDGSVEEATSVSSVIQNMPALKVDYIFVSDTHFDAAKSELDAYRQSLQSGKDQNQ